jgi:hypothetical protein
VKLTPRGEFLLLVLMYVVILVGLLWAFDKGQDWKEGRMESSNSAPSTP